VLRRLVLPLGLLFALFLVPTAIAVDGSAGAAAAKPKQQKPKPGKPKAKKCKPSQVRLKVAHRVRCVPLKAALPKPAGGDPRLAVIDEGLTPAIGQIPGPKNKIPPPAETLYRKFDPQALKATEKALGIGIAKLDQMGAARARRLLFAHTSAESGNSFSTTIGGVQIDARLSIAVDATQQLVGTVELTETRSQGGGKTVSVRTTIPLGLKQMGFEAKNGGCPTADGKVNATDSIGIAVQTEFRSNNGKTLDEYFIYEVADETDPLQGLVADDAKLDKLEIKSIEKITEKAGGSSFGGSIVNGSIVRNTVVDMRTGQYEPHVTLVSVGVKLSGVLSILAPALRPAVATRLKAAADKGFAATVKFQMDQYRQLEAVWNTPNKCAKLVFDKANRSLALHRGDSGEESARVNAAPGGSPATAKWTITGQENGSLTLNAESANPNRFKFSVPSSGTGTELKGTFRAVSKAGVAEASWIQPIESLNRITGTFSGKVVGESGTFTWSGTATFVRSASQTVTDVVFYDLVAGTETVTISGFNEELRCSQSGQAHFALTPGENGFTVNGASPPFSYLIQGSAISQPPGQGTLSGCEDPEENGEPTPIFPGSFSFKGTSLDGTSFTGSFTESEPGFSVEESWSFTAVP
jgi:hypothetical protein